MADDEMDSLFEGMVLFTPSQLADQGQGGLDHHPDPDPDPDPTPQSGDAPIPTTTTTTTTPPHQQPLDENLFSDLTLFSPLQTLADQSDPILPTTAKVSRQISRKKKRAAGLRIGYGRDAAADDLPLPQHPHDRNNDGADDDVDAESDDRNSTEGADTCKDTPSSQTNSLSLHHKQEEVDDEEDEHAKFERIKSRISDKLNRARELAASVAAARKDSIRRRRKAADDLHLASSKHGDLEKQLEDACEAEDFEKAESISQSLATAEKERLALVNALRDAEAHCDAVDSKLQEVLSSQIAAEDDSASLLQHFASDAANNADLILKKAEALSSQEMDEWLSSTEALEVEKIELEIESHLLNEARLVLNNSIEHSIEDDRREKEFLCNKRDVLTDELQNLLDLVKQKEKEIAQNDFKIKAVDEKIADVVSGFQEMQSNIDAKYDNLQSSLSQLELQSEALSARKKKIDGFLTEEEGKGANLRELARVSADEAKAYQEVVGLRRSLMMSILNSREDKVRLAKTEEKLSLYVQMLQQEVSTARASLQELSSTKSSIQQNVASFKQRIFFIDKRVPELEAEKKVAAAARNFKEAARIAAEAKSLSVEKDGIQIDVEKAVLKLEKLEEAIKDTVNRLQEIEGLIFSKEKEVAMARFQRLLLIAGAARAERLAALELGDLEEANLLLAEAEAADSEAKTLQPIYNVKEEDFENLPKHFISMELVANLGQKQLAELAASIHLAAA